jgi:hypothetical protein
MPVTILRQSVANTTPETKCVPRSSLETRRNECDKYGEIERGFLRQIRQQPAVAVPIAVARTQGIHGRPQIHLLKHVLSAPSPACYDALAQIGFNYYSMASRACPPDVRLLIKAIRYCQQAIFSLPNQQEYRLYRYLAAELWFSTLIDTQGGHEPIDQSILNQGMEDCAWLITSGWGSVPVVTCLRRMLTVPLDEQGRKIVTSEVIPALLHPKESILSNGCEFAAACAAAYDAAKTVSETA